METPYKIYGDNYTGISDLQGLPTLEITWWGILEPGMDDVLTKAGESLQPMIDRLKIYPVNISKSGQRIFMAQYKVKNNGEVNLNFLSGFPLDVLEMMVLIGEHSTLTDKVEVKPGRAGIPTTPDNLFEWPEEDRILFNKMVKAEKNDNSGLTAKMFADSLGDEKPEKHWWFNAVFSAAQAEQRKFPVPGEFIGLGVRLFIDRLWDEQLSNPFIFSGCFADTVYYSSGVVKEVIPASDEMPYPTYKVQWRKSVVTAVPSDFAIYTVGDRVSILKSIDTDKTEQTWKDDDVVKFGESWTIVPISFFDDGNGIGI